MSTSTPHHTTSDELLARIPGPLAAEVLARMDSIRHHPVFARLRSIADVRIFMEHHVWAVWDFMSLLKSIQADVAPTRVPWFPPADAEAARLINEIVAGEEGDDSPEGVHASHFAIYLKAMEAARARTASIRNFVDDLREGIPLGEALRESEAPAVSRAFVAATLEICRAPLSERVAAFTLGREELIPGMFHELARELAAKSDHLGANLKLFSWYLDRHVSMDGDRHGPMSARLFRRVCLVNDETTHSSLLAAKRVLDLRARLWDAILAALSVHDDVRRVSAATS